MGRTVEELERELAEAREQRTATAEVLRIISSSPTDVKPVFEAILENASRICDSQLAAVFRYDGELLHLVATKNWSAEAMATVASRWPMSPDPHMTSGRVVLTKKVVLQEDSLADPTYDHSTAHAGGWRRMLGVPMSRDGVVIGVIVVTWREPGPISPTQVGLLQIFADQAVIAIENTRLFEAEQARTRELSEALEQQTATSEVLGAISRSKFELQPVLDTLVASAAHLCDAAMVAIHVQRDASLPGRARHGFSVEMVEALGKIGQVMGRGSLAGRTLIEGKPVHIPDVEADAEYAFRDFTCITGARSMLGVPLLRDGRPVGLLSLYRTRVIPFTPRQIELLRTFADQAVIAIENTRLFEEVQARTRELTESLEYQTATSEVLGVISRSKFDLQPVLDTLVQSAAELCQADIGVIRRPVGDAYPLAATHGLSPEQREHLERYSTKPDRGSAFGRAIIEGRTVHIPDVLTDPEFNRPQAPSVIGVRTAVGVPLMREGVVIGVLMLLRRQPQPFSQKQIDLVETFADQAVIAIENTRLFEAEQASKRELQASLEYQTATGEVLDVISRSPNTLQPVLDTIVATAQRLCGTNRGSVWTLHGDEYRLAATIGNDEATVKYFLDNPILAGRGSLIGRVALENRTVHVPNVMDDTELKYPKARPTNTAATMLGVPLVRDGRAVGVIGLTRTAVNPFTEKQIELVETFADQAVIAIENTRLFEEVQARTKELTEALQQQTATSEVLSVISGSPGQLEAVFETMLSNAVRICQGKFGTLYLREGDGFRAVAMHNAPPAFREARQRGLVHPPADSSFGRAARTRRVAHVADITKEQSYLDGDSFRVDAVKLGGYRSVVSVPMLKEDTVVGVISLYRQDAGTFAETQIDLVKNFAKQAVIAIENTRLLSELQDSLQQQTATADVLKAISRSAFDLQAVLTELIRSAVKLCEGDFGHIRQRVGELYPVAVSFGLTSEQHALFASFPTSMTRGSVPGRALLERRIVHFPDVFNDPEFAFHDLAKTAGFRAAVGVPLVSNGQIVGVMTLNRASPRAFSEKQLALIETFADQAVIAIENTRLFEEVQARTRELAKTVEDLEIASQHKSQFVANMSHELRTPLAAILGYAELMQEGFYEPLGKKSLDALTRIGSNGKHLLGLINTVLDIAKIESGQFSLNLGEYAVESVVETVRAATESLAETKKLALKTDVTKKLPVGLGDEQRLTQVLLNLVGNAIKFTDTGEVRITATAVNGHFTVAVTDTGPGIPQQELNRVFEQFHQIDNSNTKAKGGTGLGLAIAKQIVEMHGGRIWVKSTLGKGATFQMELPIRAPNH